MLSGYTEKNVIFNSIKVQGTEDRLSELRRDNGLVQYALDKINEEREKYSLSPVNLSKNNAAQIHAENLFATRNQYPSHWTTDGMKPYMKYSEYNGTGYVEQNVAIRGYEKNCYTKM